MKRAATLQIRREGHRWVDTSPKRYASVSFYERYVRSLVFERPRSFVVKVERDPIDVHVGNRLRIIRTARRLSLEELGRRIGVTYQQIQKYETGANRVSASTLYRISQVFETTPTFFFEGLEDNRAEEEPAAAREALQSSIALGRIEDQEVRRRLRMLIEALDPGLQREG
nr:helix-turn-helix transcriptional regulator [Aureimonas jatrophae]